MIRPRDKTILNTIEYLNSIGLFVYGPCVDLESGEQYAAQMDFSAKDVIKYRKLIETTELWEA